jgi:hypothetical protein
MDWLNRARQYLGNLFGGAARTVGNIAGGVARGVSQGEQQAARVAQQAVRNVQRNVPQAPRFQLPQVNIQAPRIQMPQAPKVDFGAVNRALQGFQQGAQQFGEGANIGFKQLTGQQLTPKQQQVVDILKQQVPVYKVASDVLKANQQWDQQVRQRQIQANKDFVNRFKTSPATAIFTMPALSPFGNVAQAYKQFKVATGKELPKFDTTKAVEDLSTALAQTPLKNIPGAGVVGDIVKPLAMSAARMADVAQTQEQYANGIKGLGQMGSDIANVGSLFYSGGLAKQLGTKGVAFLPTAAKLAPRLAASGAGQNIIQQLAEGKKLNEIDPKQIAAAAAAYTGLGIGIPGIARGVNAGIGKVLSKGQSAIATKAAQALPADKNELVIVRTLPEKGALRAQGYTNVQVQFQPKPGQVTPTIPGRAIAETAPVPKEGKLPLNTKERGFVTSVKTSQEVSDDVKAVVSGEYTPKSNQVLINNADKFTKNPQKAYTSVNEQLSKPWGTVNDQEIANAITLAKKLDASGNKDAAGEVYDKLAQHLTQAGRDVQAASLLSRRTPEGLLFNARRTLKKAGIEITPQIQKELQTNIDIIKKTVVGSEQRNIAIAKMQKDLVKHIPQKALDNIVSVWKAGLLSGAKTQGGNFLSNATFGTMKLASNPITAAVDKVMSVFTGKRTFALTGKGLASGGVEGAKKGVFTLKTGIDTRNFATGAAKFDQVAEINFNNKAVQSIIGTPSNWVFRGMSAADQPFYFAALKNSLYSQAIAEAKNQGLKGKALNDFLSNSLSNPSKTMLNIARNEADKAVLGFDTMLSRAVSAIHKSVETSNLTPVGKATANAIVNFIAPFTRVPSAFLSRTIDYTPLGMTAQIFKAIGSQIKTGTFDQRALAQAIGEGATGTGLIVLGAQLANADLLSGDYPKNDQKEQARWKAKGITPNSVKLGDTWVSLNYLGPLGLLFGAGKNFVDARKEGGTMTDIAAQTIGGFGSGLLQQSFLQGLNGFTQAVNDPGRFAGPYVKSFVGSFVPSWINDIANITDQFKRQANTPLEAAMARIPGLRQNLPAQTDVFGRQLETGGIQSIDPFKPSPSVQTPLTNELDRLKTTGKENNAWPTPVDNKDFFGKGTEIDKKQMQQIQSELGPLVNQTWNDLIQTPTYQQANDQQKKNLLDKTRQQITIEYKIANASKYGQTYTGPQPKQAKTPKVKVSKARKGRTGRAGTARTRVSLKATKLRAIKVSVPKGKKVSFKQPTATKARKSIKIKTG